jgi:cyclomaltodextrinase / maltogenic alpha-amylase / neopullulanase
VSWEISGNVYLEAAPQCMQTMYLSIAWMFVILLSGPSVLRAQVPEPPFWARGAVWYLLLPDRFHNADTTNDPTAADVLLDSTLPWKVSEWTADWYKRTLNEIMLYDSFYPAAMLRQYGGDFEGIRSRLDYLDSLGVTGVILTPTFEARSSHKFDVSTLHHMDRHFGPRLAVDTMYLKREVPDDPNTWYLTSADRAFIDLIAELRRRGMRVLLMAQFAHCGADFWAFRDVLTHQEKSRFGTWFTVSAWDKPETPYQSEFAYQKMWGIDAFPRFRQDTLGLAPGPREYVYAATRRWMDPNGDGNPNDGIDGWCIDLTSELPPVFWRNWADFCRSINPDIMLVNLEGGTGRAAAPFDVDSPQRFAEALSGFALSGALTSTNLDAALSSIRSRTTLNGSDALMNLIGSHETDRIASMCVNSSLRYDQKNSPLVNAGYDIRKPDEKARALQRMLLLLQFTLPGSPVLYYGDEAGMWGADDPDNRKPMLWPDMTFDPEVHFEINGDPEKHHVAFDSTVFRYYRTLIALRERFPSLKTGSMQSLLIDDVASLYAFTRSSGADKAFIVVNAGDDAQTCTLSYLGMPDGTALTDPLQNVTFYVARDGVSLTLPPKTATILVPKHQL